MILVPARAISGRDLLRDGLVLAGPRNDAAGVVGVVDVDLGASCSAQQQNADHGQQRRARHPHLPICPRPNLRRRVRRCKAASQMKAEAWPERHSRRFLAWRVESHLDFAGVRGSPLREAIVGDRIMSGRALLLACAFAAALAAAPAAPASWFEMNFYMSGPEYEGK